MLRHWQGDQIGPFFANRANPDFLEEVPKEMGNSFGYFFTIISGLLKVPKGDVLDF